MKVLCRIFVVLIVAISLSRGSGTDVDLKKSVNFLIQTFRQHDRLFIYSLKPMIASILTVSRAQLHVRLGILNVTADTLEDIKTFEKQLALYSPFFLKTIDEVKLPDDVVNLRHCIKTLNEVMAKRREFLDAGEESVDRLASEFDRAFVDKLIIASDALYESLYNKFHADKQLFEQFAVISYQHPIETMAFMHGCFQILTQLIMLEENHVKLSLKTKDAVEAFERVARQRWDRILNLANKIDVRQNADTEIVKQIEKDQKRFHQHWKTLSHCDFAIQAKWYFEGKYPKYKYLVISYDDVRGYDNHAMESCVTMYNLYSYSSRNSVIFQFPSYYSGDNFFDWAQQLLNKVPDYLRLEGSKANKLLNAVTSHSSKQCELGAAFVVTMNSQICYRGPIGYTMEKNKNVVVCNTSLCWITVNHPYRVIIAGRRSTT